MMQIIRAWLNGGKDYFEGVGIYSSVSKNKSLTNLFSKGFSKYNQDRLAEELKTIYLSMKNEAAQLPPAAAAAKKLEKQKEPLQSTVIENPKTVNQIYEDARSKAMAVYKECMNKRAVLFNLAKVESWQDINAPHRVLERSKLCIEVIELYNQASRLFDIAEFVKTNNRLPTDVINDKLDPFKDLPDYLVKLELSNARKALQKIRAKPVTEARLLLAQKHIIKIEILERKWASLNSIPVTEAQ